MNGSSPEECLPAVVQEAGPAEGSQRKVDEHPQRAEGAPRRRTGKHRSEEIYTTQVMQEAESRVAGTITTAIVRYANETGCRHDSRGREGHRKVTEENET